MRKISFLLGIFLIILCSGCSNDRGVEEGLLSDSVWERKYSSKSSVYESNLTYTVRFTSGKAGMYSTTGTWSVYSSSTKKWTSGMQNDHNSFTYIYSPDLKQGVWTYSNGKQTVFTISSDNKTLSTGGSPYTRK